MKKIAIAFAAICLSSAALAEESVRIINYEPYKELTVKTQICTFRGFPMQPTCVDQAPIVIPSYLNKAPAEKHYVDITLTEKDSFVHVSSVTAEYQGVIDATGKYPITKTCTASETGDAIVLNSFATDRVYCNDHNIGNANQDN